MLNESKNKLTADLSEKTALVASGGRGIGRAISLALAEAGADVAICARSAAEIETVAGLIDQLARALWPWLATLHRKYFGSYYPAMALFEVKGLFNEDALIEMEGLAHIHTK